MCIFIIPFQESKTHFRCMAQLERVRRSLGSSGSSQVQCSPTFEMARKVDEKDWSILSRQGSSVYYEEWQSPSNKKSVLSIVKEKVKKLKHNLSGRKNAPEIEFNEESTKETLTYDDHTDDCDEDLHEEAGVDDPEYFGAPMYESEAAPETLKETARQHPRAVPVVSENHRIPNKANSTESINKSLPKKEPYATISNPTQETSSNLPELPISTSEPQETSVGRSDDSGTRSPGYENSGNLNQCPPRRQDKGGSMKEYVMNKLQLGEDERALSHATSSLNNNSNVVGKVKEAVTSLFSPRLTQSANANKVLEEENHGKILQTN